MNTIRMIKAINLFLHILADIYSKRPSIYRLHSTLFNIYEHSVGEFTLKLRHMTARWCRLAVVRAFHNIGRHHGDDDDDDYDETIHHTHMNVVHVCMCSVKPVCCIRVNALVMYLCKVYIKTIYNYIAHGYSIKILI